MNGVISIKQTITAILGLLALLGAAWGIDERFMTREIHELKSDELKTEYRMMISDMQKQMIQIQRNNQLSSAQNQLWYWQSQVENLTGMSAKNPWDANVKEKLIYAKGKRDYWQDKVNELINQ
jgi:hypothetical protein